MADSLRLWWVWRERGKSGSAIHRRSLFLFLLALTFTAITLAAGVFSSYVVSSSDLEVLVGSPFCGIIPAWESDFSDSSDTYPMAVIEASDTYASRCYQNASTHSAVCKVFIHPALPYNITRVPCPFASPLCLEQDPHAVELDTGLIDVTSTFGLNIPRQDRVRYQKKTTCSVLPLGNFTKIVDASKIEDTFGRKAIFPEEKILTLNYGTHPALPENITRWYPIVTANISRVMSVT